MIPNPSKLRGDSQLQKQPMSTRQKQLLKQRGHKSKRLQLKPETLLGPLLEHMEQNVLHLGALGSDTTSGET